MASSDLTSWHAAIDMWKALDPGQQGFVIGFIASQDADLVARAAQACVARPGRNLAAEVSGLDARQARDVLRTLSGQLPGVLAQALDDTLRGGA